MARRRGLVLLSWTALLIVCGALNSTLKSELSAPDYGVEGSQSEQVEQLLQTPQLHSAGSEQDVVVFHSLAHRAEDRAYRVVVERVLHTARASPDVRSVLSPYSSRSRISRDGHVAVAPLALGGNARERFVRAGDLQRFIVRSSHDGVAASLTGFSPLSKDLAQVETSDGERAEAIGLPVALLILILALGALLAAAVPLLLAGAGLLATFGVIAILATLLRFDVFLLTIVTMIGVGIGIDYSLFIVSRFREELARTPEDPRRERRRIAEAVGASVATSGRTIAYSGVIVALSLTSLLVLRAPIFREFVIGTLASVACALAASLTLLPALLAQLGQRVNAGSLPARLQPSEISSEGVEYGGWARWAVAMMRRPVVVSVAVSLILVIAMAPTLGLRYGINIGVPALSATPSGSAADAIAQSFGPGMIAPLAVVVDARSVEQASGGGGADHASGKGGAAATTPSGGGSAATGASKRGRSTALGRSGRSNPALVAGRALARELQGDRRVAAVAIRSFGGVALLTVVPAVAVDSPAAYALVRHVRTDVASNMAARYGASVLVGGAVAQAVDVSAETSGKLALVIAITLGMALVFLLSVFRSVVLPIKAVAMNLLATGATLGLVVLIFQDGHGEGLLGFVSSGFIQSFLPLCMFVLLFGLSMDYEVFLIRRMQETWRETADNRLAVVSGVAHTARPISAAAAIMVAVFGSFLTANVLELKQFGFALAAAIAIDATLIRLMLVPALMCLLGARNWWLPQGLERLLPRLEPD